MGTAATVWLALGTAFIAAGASVLTAWLGHTYSLKRLREEQAATKRQWMRSQKQAAYENVLNVSQEVFFGAVDVNVNPAILLQNLKTASAVAIVYGPDSVRNACTHVTDVGTKYVFGADAFLDNVKEGAHPTQQQADFEKAIDALRDAIHSDMQETA